MTHLCRFVAVAITTALAAATVAPVAAAQQLTFADEFNGSALNLTKWSYRALGPRFDAIVTTDAVTVANGALTIRTYTRGARHYTGMISSLGLAGGFQQAFGTFEARVRFNNPSGTMSSFWLQSPTLGMPLGDPATAGVEMDIAEHRARCTQAPAPTPPATCSPTNDITDRIQQALIWDGYGAESKSKVRLSDPLPGLGNGSWHTWTLRWTPADVTFLYDGVVTWVETYPISQRAQYIILSTDVIPAVAGAIPAGGYGSRATTTTRMDVDYVRVWSLT